MRLVGKGDGNASSMSRAASTGSTHTMVSQGTLGSATVSAFTAATALSMPATVAGSSGPPASDLSGLGRRISTSRAPYHDDTAIGSSTSTSMPQTPTAGLGPTKGQNGSLLAANGPGQSRLALSNSLSTSCMSSATSTSSAVLVSSATANGSAAAPDVTAGLPPLPPHAPSSVVSDPWLVSPKACKPVSGWMMSPRFLTRRLSMVKGSQCFLLAQITWWSGAAHLPAEAADVKLRLWKGGALTEAVPLFLNPGGSADSLASPQLPGG
jgi:hypothetical protein